MASTSFLVGVPNIIYLLVCADGAAVSTDAAEINGLASRRPARAAATISEAAAPAEISVRLQPAEL